MNSTEQAQPSMASFTCAYSGLEIHTTYFPLHLHARESHHCIFDAPQRTLFNYVPKWAHHELTREDSYLLFVALLKSSGRVHFRQPARYSQGASDAIVANNMEKLLIALSRMNSINAPGEIFAAVAINQESCVMENAKHWIDNWLSNYEEFKSNYSFAANAKKLTMREAALKRMIKSPHRDVSYYAVDLAKWASLAGNFPAGLTLVDGVNVPLAEYWEGIIIAAANKRFFTIPKKDLEEVVVHCDENVAPGSIYHHKLMLVLREAKSYLEGFLGDLSGRGLGKRVPIWNFVEGGSEQSEGVDEPDIFAANLDRIVAAAPTIAPVRANYSTNMQYISAKIKYDAAQSVLAARKEIAAGDSSTTGEQE